MHLKRLELYGFKTFADRTEVEFLPGITAVVGPNGSGKSNLAEAIQWVLGEQSLRSLRTLSSQEVIFSGTTRRRPLGLAEVHLTFDNTCGTLPLPFSEVTVSRRLFRSGESVYQINKVACRLRDVVSLFLDTGIGAGAYAFIGQGEVDAVLSAKPEDRRALVEEAAGIQAYRVRKREALRKLETTQANLRRAEDVIAEVQSQVPPLRAQAEVARQYRWLRERIQSLERALLLTDYQDALREVTRLNAAHQTASDRVAAHQAELARRESEAEATRLAAARAETAWDEASRASTAVSQKVERAHATLSVLRERLSSLQVAEATSAARMAELAQTLERLTRRQQEVDERIAQAEAAEQAAAKARQECEEALAEVNERIREASGAVEQQQQQALERARALTNAQAEWRSAVSHLAEREQARTRALQHLQALNSRLQTLDGRVQALKKKVNDAEALHRDLTEEIQHLETTLQTLRQEVQQGNQQIAEMRLAWTQCTTRLRTLRELQEKREGYREGARAVLQAEREGYLKGHFVPIADLLEVAPEYEAAISAALGDDLDALVASSLEEAEEALSFLQREGKGRATFVIPSACGHLQPLDGALQAVGQRAADQCVRCRPEHFSAIQALLGDALVVRDLEEARQVLSLDHGRFRAVTLKGDLLHTRGVLKGGKEIDGAASLLSRRREIAALQEEAARLEASLAAMKDEARLRSAALAEAEKALRQKRAASENAAATLATARRNLQEAAQERQRLVEEQRRAEENLCQIETDRKKAMEEEEHLRRRVQAFQTEDASADAEADRAHALLRDLFRQRDALTEAISEHKIAAARARQQAEGLRESATRDAQQVAEIRVEWERRRAESAKRVEDLAALGEEIASKEADLARLTEHQEHAQRHLEHCREERRRCLAACAQAEERVKEIRNRLTGAQRALHRTEVKRAEAESHLRHLQTALFEQFGIGADEARRLVETGDFTKVSERQQASEELREWRTQMAQLGEVNLKAIEDLQRLEERLAFLVAQRNDLLEAQQSLKRVMAEIDSEARRRYLDTVEALRVAFAEIFCRLFGGGTTMVQVTGGEDPLEGGLEILVQPPGRKAQSLLLLSGGERALTAIAFLFALLKIKPSPFVLLDEVDAPLDQTNVARFCALLREFAQRSQFIVITHNLATMEAADALYGVAMPEAGVSKMVSVRLEEAVRAA